MHRELSEKLFIEQTSFCENENLLKERLWTVITREYPDLIIEFSATNKVTIHVHMICNDWDEMPCSIIILDIENKPLDSAKFPKGHGLFNNSLHHKFKRPFICTPGTLEYHTHSSHIKDIWENYKLKSGFDIGGILTQIWNAWRCTN